VVDLTVWFDMCAPPPRHDNSVDPSSYMQKADDALEMRQLEM